MSDTLLVVGSNSFSGAHFVAHALEQGHEVIAVSRASEPPAVFLPYRRGAHARLRVYQCDLNHDLERLAGIIATCRPSRVVNFAAQGMVAESWQDPAQWYTTNLVAAVRLHDVLRTAGGIEKFVQISTPEVYGNCSGSVDETARLAPSTPYAVSKAACDLSLAAYYRHYGFPVVTTRAANVYGPCQQLYRIIPRAILCVRRGVKLILHGGGAAQRSFIHIRDVCAATLALAFRGEPGETYHLATESVMSIRALVALICRIMGAEFDDVVTPGEARPGTDAVYRLDTAKVRRLLGWRPRITLEEGLRETIAWVDEHYALLCTLPQDYVHKR